MTKEPKYITLTAALEAHTITFSYQVPGAGDEEIVKVPLTNGLNAEKKIEKQAAQLGDRYHQIVLIERRYAA